MAIVHFFVEEQSGKLSSKLDQEGYSGLVSVFGNNKRQIHLVKLSGLLLLFIQSYSTFNNNSSSIQISPVYKFSCQKQSITPRGV